MGTADWSFEIGMEETTGGCWIIARKQRECDENPFAAAIKSYRQVWIVERPKCQTVCGGTLFLQGATTGFLGPHGATGRSGKPGKFQRDRPLPGDSMADSQPSRGEPGLTPFVQFLEYRTCRINLPAWADRIPFLSPATVA
jgi:hypothetical protein